MKYIDYNERKKHGTPEFPIEYYYLDSDHPQYSMPPHWHSEFEIIRIKKGIFTAYLNNEEYILKEGNILLVPPITLHRGIPQDAIYECIVFDANMLKRKRLDTINQYISAMSEPASQIKRIVPDDDFAAHLYIDSLFTEMAEANANYELTVLGSLFMLFGHLFKNEYVKSGKNHPIYNKKAATVIKLLSYVDDHFSEQITLDALSDIVNKEKKYVCRIFKEYTSKSPIDYVNDRRVDFAKQLIKTTDRTITEIAYDSGFNDSGYFSKIFKKCTGSTPREFKKQNIT